MAHTYITDNNNKIVAIEIAPPTATYGHGIKVKIINPMRPDFNRYYGQYNNIMFYDEASVWISHAMYLLSEVELSYHDWRHGNLNVEIKQAKSVGERIKNINKAKASIEQKKKRRLKRVDQLIAQIDLVKAEAAKMDDLTHSLNKVIDEVRGLP